MTNLIRRPMPAICVAILATIFVADGFSNSALAQPGASYPRVYTPTGRLYGPTQANYQYQKQYGRSWHGYRGIRTRSRSVGYRSHHITIPYSTYGYHSYGWNPYYGNSYYGYSPVIVPEIHAGVVVVNPLAPISQPYPTTVYPPGAYQNTTPYHDPNVYPPANPVLRKTWNESQKTWNQPLDWRPVTMVAKKPVTPSSPQDQLRSLKHMQRAQADMENLRFTEAYVHYKKAVAEAPDLVVPRVHMAVVLATLGKYDRAVRHFKDATDLDSEYPYSMTLDSIYTKENFAAKEATKERLINWVKDDIRSADRLFLMGAFLFLDNDQVRAKELLETSVKLGGVNTALAAFLIPPAKENKVVQPSNIDSVHVTPKGKFPTPKKTFNSKFEESKKEDFNLTVPPAPTPAPPQLKNGPVLIPPQLNE